MHLISTRNGKLGDRGVATDPAAIDACRRGDRAALGAVLHACSPDLERLLVRLLGPGADVQDVLQQTFIAAIGAFPGFRGEASVRTWLGRIAVHQAYAVMRRPEVTRRAPLSLVTESRLGVVPGPDHAHDAKAQVARLYEHLSAIAPRQRIAFVLHVVEGQSMEQVAALMDASVAATKSRVMWARRTLIKKAQRDPLLRELVTGGAL